MSTLLVWREKLQRLYASYSVYILKALQFLLGLIVFGLINADIGFIEAASSPLCTLGLAVICAFFPMTVMVFAAAVLILVQLYSLSIPVAAVGAVLFLLMYIFYFRFTPKKAWLLLVAAVSFGLKIPFIIPAVFGLLGAPVWVVPAACGAFSYYFVSCVKASATVLKSSDSEKVLANITGFTKQFFSSKEMWVMIMAVVIAILVVNVIRKRPIEHAWKIASVSGAAVSTITAVAGNIALGAGVSYIEVVASAVLGAAVGIVLEFLFFFVDYSRTENIQFEDDEYYYYVKAVPKIGVAAPEKTVKHITERHNQDDETSEKGDESGNISSQNKKNNKAAKAASVSEETSAADEISTDEILLTRSLSKELGLDQDEGEV